MLRRSYRQQAAGDEKSNILTYHSELWNQRQGGPWEHGRQNGDGESESESESPLNDDERRIQDGRPWPAEDYCMRQGDGELNDDEGIKELLRKCGKRNNESTMRM